MGEHHLVGDFVTSHTLGEHHLVGDFVTSHTLEEHHLVGDFVMSHTLGEHHLVGDFVVPRWTALTFRLRGETSDLKVTLSRQDVPYEVSIVVS